MDINLLSKMIIKKICSVNTVFSAANDVAVREKRLYWAVLIKYEGETIYTSGGKKHKSNIKNIALLPKGSSYSWICNQEGRYMVVEFDADLEGESVFTVPTKQGEALLKIFAELENAWTLRHPLYELKCMQLTYSLLYKILGSSSSGYSPSGRQEKIQPALDYIAQNYNKQISNDSLAKMLGISTVYFRKLFSETVGTSPISYMHRLRVKKAKEMLRGDFTKISVISETVGYSNIYHFSKMFKLYTGLSPTEYSRKHR